VPALLSARAEYEISVILILLQVAVVGERRCGKSSLAEALRRSAAAREAAAAAGDSSTDVDDLAGTGSGWCRLDVVDLSAGRHLDVYGRGLEVDAYILAFDVTSIQAAGSAHHNGTAAALTSRHAARLQMWLQALHEVSKLSELYLTPNYTPWTEKHTEMFLSYILYKNKLIWKKISV